MATDALKNHSLLIKHVTPAQTHEVVDKEILKSKAVFESRTKHQPSI